MNYKLEIMTELRELTGYTTEKLENLVSYGRKIESDIREKKKQDNKTRGDE